MRPSSLDQRVQCEDCGRWLPLSQWLKHWHDAEQPQDTVGITFAD